MYTKETHEVNTKGMIDVDALGKKTLSETKLEILVFGPAVDPPSSDPYTASLQVKRKEIKKRLIDEGHNAAYGEDVVAASLPAHIPDPLIPEIIAMRAADMIILLLGGAGPILEARTITAQQELCSKTSFYCFEEYKDGLVVRHLQSMTVLGATCELTSLADVQACHLTTAILKKVRAIQTAKAFLY